VQGLVPFRFLAALLAHIRLDSKLFGGEPDVRVHFAEEFGVVCKDSFHEGDVEDGLCFTHL
jgi:hypothetical protein